MAVAERCRRLVRTGCGQIEDDDFCTLFGHHAGCGKSQSVGAGGAGDDRYAVC
jgi:hypothetical protein